VLLFSAFRAMEEVVFWLATCEAYLVQVVSVVMPGEDFLQLASSSL
jgi:hypothetical protein